MKNLTVVNETKIKLSAAKIKKILFFLNAQLKKNKTLRNRAFLNRNDLTCVFLSAKAMQKINKHYRKKDKPTDVLSFASLEQESLGELLFCLSVLKEQAREQKHSLGHEFSYMLIHGILHLLGYDHELSKKEEKLMFKIQDHVFQQLTDSKIKLDL